MPSLNLDTMPREIYECLKDPCDESMYNSMPRLVFVLCCITTVQKPTALSKSKFPFKSKFYAKCQLRSASELT